MMCKYLLSNCMCGKEHHKRVGFMSTIGFRKFRVNAELYRKCLQSNFMCTVKERNTKLEKYWRYSTEAWGRTIKIVECFCTLILSLTKKISINIFNERSEHIIINRLSKAKRPTRCCDCQDFLNVLKNAWKLSVHAWICKSGIVTIYVLLHSHSHTYNIR